MSPRRPHPRARVSSRVSGNSRNRSIYSFYFFSRAKFMKRGYRPRCEGAVQQFGDAARRPSTPSLDHLVGAGEESFRNCEIKSLCRLEVDDQFEFRRLLNWEIGRFLPLKNAVDVTC